MAFTFAAAAEAATGLVFSDDLRRILGTLDITDISLPLGWSVKCEGFSEACWIRPS
jgi:hypothetical protein